MTNNSENNNSNEAVKARVTKRVQRTLLTCMMISIPIFIGYFIWASSFMVIVPPDKYDTLPDGAILWSYWPDRENQLMAPDFIQELNLKTLLVIGYIKVKKDRKPLQLPYIRRLHEIVSGDIGQVEKEIKEPENEVVPEVIPRMKEMDDSGMLNVCGEVFKRKVLYKHCKGLILLEHIWG